MKYKKSICILVFGIVILSLIACLFGLFSNGGTGEYLFKTINNDMVKIDGRGLYKNDSISIAAQGRASDFVTLVLGVPMLLVSVYFAIKGSFRGKLMLTGTLGFFLYTFMSYTFLWMYNQFFIIYVAVMSLSLFAFILSMMSFDIENIALRFGKKLPVKLLGGYQIFLAFFIGMMWLGIIAPTIFEGSVPEVLEHYTTLVIQGMDLGIIVPATILSGILLIKRRPFGYLLSSVLIFKGITMLTAISAMIINLVIKGVKVSPVELIVFPIFNIITVIFLVILLKNAEGKSRS